MIRIVKRNGKETLYNQSKIRNAITRAFWDAGISDKEYVSSMCDSFIEDFEREVDGVISVEEIQDMVEVFLMKNACYGVAKEYILYRQNKTESRNYAARQLAFIEKYKKSDNNANATIDDNSNVNTHNIATINAEIHKADNVQTSRYMIMSKLQELYPDFDAKQYVRDLKSHIIYKHDESTFPGAIAPYTYSAKEVVEVKFNDKRLLLPLYALYDLVYNTETSPEDGVFRKFPEELYVKDKNNDFVKVTAVTKKKRHRDLVRIKTSFGEDLVVTDNHPMIIDEKNIDNTVDAIDSNGKPQYKIDDKLVFDGIKSIDLSEVLPGEVFSNYIKFNKAPIKRHLELSREFGYFVGFFVGDGHYKNSDEYIQITQKDVKVLIRLNEILYDHLGIIGNIYYKNDNSNAYVLSVNNRSLFYIFRDFFKIDDKSYNKTLPLNILQFTEDFAKGVLEGLIDSDGTVSDANILVRLSSRAAILQVTALFRHFGYSVGNVCATANYNLNKSYNTDYMIWGVNAGNNENSAELSNSFKLKSIGLRNKSLKYRKSGETKITNVDVITNEAFLSQNDYIYDITTETHTFASNNILVHNCASISMYPFLLGGIKELGGLSAAPKNLDSYCGMFCNLVFAIAGQFAGAIATSEFLLYFDHFAKLKWGQDYYKHLDEHMPYLRYENGKTLRVDSSIKYEICQKFQQVVYTINQPTGARGNQACFWNVSYFDKPFFESMFGNFVFPDGDVPKWESLDALQRLFMSWFNEERNKVIITFPVETVATIYKDGQWADPDTFDFVCEEYSKGHSMFMYISDTADSLSSCCRLKNKLQTKEFSFTNGNMGLETGSKSVITLNLNRIVQDWMNGSPTSMYLETDPNSFLSYLKPILERIYKYHEAYNEILYDMFNSHLLPVYEAGFINLDKQYLTIGINGLNEAAEYLGMKCNVNDDYQKFCDNVFSFIKEQNAEHRTKTLHFNTEMVPAESLAVKNYNWDKADGYSVPDDRNLYASYIFKPNDPSLNIYDKIILHGEKYIGDHLDGGSAAHLNLSEHPSKEQVRTILTFAAMNGCQYLTFNVPNCQCVKCEHITKSPIEVCPCCGGTSIDIYDRIIGYLTKIKNWSSGRQEEQLRRVYLSLQSSK